MAGWSQPDVGASPGSALTHSLTHGGAAYWVSHVTSQASGITSRMGCPHPRTAPALCSPSLEGWLWVWGARLHAGSRVPGLPRPRPALQGRRRLSCQAPCPLAALAGPSPQNPLGSFLQSPLRSKQLPTGQRRSWSDSGGREAGGRSLPSKAAGKVAGAGGSGGGAGTAPSGALPPAPPHSELRLTDSPFSPGGPT